MSTAAKPPTKRIAIVQSNYIPWKGYFDLIAAVDEFIFYDDMQYTRRSWRNRNQIKTPKGAQWLTVPVKVKGKYHQTIRETEIEGTGWAKTHWNAIAHNYRRAPHYEEIAAIFEPIYLQQQHTHLSPLNRKLTSVVCKYLDITTKLSNSWDYTLIEGRTERLSDLCAQAGGTEYISGPLAKNYLDESIFVERGIKLHWFDYGSYTEYPQLWGSFTHTVSILDLLFNCGKNAARHLMNIKA